MLFAIAAVPGSLLIARFGLLRALLVGLLLTALGGAARGAMADATSLFASTIVMAAGVSIMQPTFPPLVRSLVSAIRRFRHGGLHHWTPDRRNSAGIADNSMVLPLVHDSWRLNFVFWSFRFC